MQAKVKEGDTIANFLFKEQLVLAVIQGAVKEKLDEYRYRYKSGKFQELAKELGATDFV